MDDNKDPCSAAGYVFIEACCGGILLPGFASTYFKPSGEAGVVQRNTSIAQVLQIMYKHPL